LNKIDENWDLFEHETKIKTYLKKLDENWDEKSILTYLKKNKKKTCICTGQRLVYRYNI